MASNAKKKKTIWGLPSHRTVFTEEVDITPDIAALMLTYNTRNRPPSPQMVATLADKMESGDWVFTHQGVAFNKDGKLLDGQTRLAAIVQSDCAIRLNVTYNLDDVFESIDVDQRVRTSHHLLHIQAPHLKNKTLMCATGHIMLRGLRGEGVRFSTKEVARFTLEQEGTITPFVAQIRKGEKIVRRAAVVSAFTAAVRQDDDWPGPRGHRDHDAVMLMAIRLSEMDWEGKADPMRALFTRLLRNADSKREGSLLAAQVYAMTVSAIRAGIAERGLTSIIATEIDWGEEGDNGGKIVKRRKVLRRPKP